MQNVKKLIFHFYMKRLYLIFLILISNIAITNLSATVIQLTSPNNIYTVLNTINDGDIIELISPGGEYVWSSQISSISEKNFTIRAKKGLTIKPTIRYSGTSGGFLRYNSSANSNPTTKWVFEGIVFNGYNNTAGYYATSFFTSNITFPNYGINIDVKNCIFKNFSQRAFNYTGTNAPTSPANAMGGDLSIRNTEFKDCRLSSINGTTSLSYSPNNVLLYNNLFWGTAVNFINLNSGNYNSYQIDHCSFINSSERELNLSSTKSNSYIQNSLFSNNTSITINNYDVSLTTNSGVFYTGTGNKNTIYPNSSTARSINPQTDLTTGFSKESSYLNGTTDGLPTGYFGIQIFASEDEINNLNYNFEHGPSAAKSFLVSASRLTNNLKIEAPANFEISLNENSDYSSTIDLFNLNGEISTTKIFIRLKSDLISDFYTGTIHLVSQGAATQTINVSGIVSDKPSIFTSANNITDLSYTLGSGPSTQQSITINAANLTSSITVVASSNFEISLYSGSSFTSSNTLYISNNSGIVTQLKVYVRLKSALATNNYNGTISISSTDADTKTININGQVTNVPASIELNKNSISNINYSYGNGPSTIQSFTVKGTGLTSNITITAPLNYEISLQNGTSFDGKSTITLNQNTGSVNLTNIYLRLRKDRAVGFYDEKIEVVSTGASTKELNLSGFVSQASIIALTTSSITGFDYLINNGPSVEKSFSISASNLVSDVIITAPSNFEISTSSGKDFIGSGQILLEKSIFNSSSTTIYVRLKEGLSTNIYNGNISINSSGATTRTISLSANVYPLPVSAVDTASYNKRHNGTLSFINKWIFSKTTKNYNSDNEIIAANNSARDMCFLKGKLLFPDRINKQIVIIDTETGLKDKALSLDPSLFTYIGRNRLNTNDSTYTAGVYQFYSLNTDNAGNLLIGNSIQSNKDRYQIYKIDTFNGKGTLLIDQANLESLFPTATNMRLDFFSVWGDINTNATLIAANGSTPAMEVYKWRISNGIASNPEIIHLDNVSLGTTLSGLESIGGFPRTSFITEDLFYVDGGNIYPTLVHSTGKVYSGFYEQATAIVDSISASAQKWIMDSGNNGVAEFSIDNQHFLLTASSNAASNPSSSFRLFRFIDSSKSFQNIECLWTFPKAGMGSSSNNHRTALPIVKVNGKTASIFVYIGENGYAKYELSYNPLATSTFPNYLNSDTNFHLQNNKVIFRGEALSLSIYNVTGQLVANISNTNQIEFKQKAGIYIVKATDIKGNTYAQRIHYDK